MKLPCQDNLSALIHEPTFKKAVGDGLFNKARVITTLGNRAVHSHRAIPVEDSLAAVRDLPRRILARPHVCPCGPSAAMNLCNFAVRPRRRLVEKYA